jgi:hypothetical protein
MHAGNRLCGGWRTVTTYEMVRVGDLGGYWGIWSAYVLRGERANACVCQTVQYASLNIAHKSATKDIAVFGLTAVQGLTRVL